MAKRLTTDELLIVMQAFEIQLNKVEKQYKKTGSEEADKKFTQYAIIHEKLLDIYIKRIEK